MWPIHAKLSLYILLTCLGMWSGKQTLQGARFLPGYLFAASKKANAQGFVVAATGGINAAAQDNGHSIGPGDDRHGKSSKKNILGRRRRCDTDSLLNCNPCGDTIVADTASDLAAPVSKSSTADSTVLGFIQELLARIGSTKGPPKQHVALNALRVLIESQPACINSLERLNIIDTFVSVLKQRYQRSFWSVLQSYFRSNSRLEEMQWKAMETTLLTILLTICRSNVKLRSVMAKNERFKSLLLTMYNHNKKKDDKNTNLAKKHGKRSSAKSNSELETDAEDAYQIPVARYDTSPYNMRDAAWLAASGERSGAMDVLSLQTRGLIRELMFMCGIDVESQNLKQQGASAKAKPAARQLVAVPVDTSVPIDAPAQGTNLPNQWQLPVPPMLLESSDGWWKGKAGQPKPRLLWIPYFYVPKNTKVEDAVKRHLLINLGDSAGEKVDLTNLLNVTIEHPRNKAANVVYGMLLLCKEGSDKSNGGCSLYTQTSSAKHKGNYVLISNIQVGKSKEINGSVVAGNLLKNMQRNESLKTITRVVNELWALVGSKDPDVLNELFRDLDFEFLAEVLNRSLVYTVRSDVFEQVSSNIETPSNGSGAYAMLQKLRRTVEGCLHKVMPKLRDSFWDKIFERSTDTMPATEQETTPSPENVLNNIRPCKKEADIARRLQTVVLGFLIDLIYMDGSRSLNKIRRATPLVDAVLRLRATFPAVHTLTEALDNELEDFAPLIDRRRNDARHTTNVIYKYIDRLSADDLTNMRSRKRDNFGNITTKASDWCKESWTRQKTIPRAIIGPFFNAHKLLNMLGHHEQDIFKGRGLRVLSIDGGGTKGVVVLEILEQIEKLLGRPLHEVFDFICGTSCGGIIGALLALEKGSIADIRRVFEDFMVKVFNKDSYHVTGRRLITRHAYYDEKMLYDSLRSVFGNAELIDYSVDPAAPKFCCLSAQLDVFPLNPIVWRNYNYPPDTVPGEENPMRDGSCAIMTADALRATTAAPTYFPLMERNGALYGDGALYANNPSLVALLEARLVYPNVPIDLLVSVGSGDWEREDIAQLSQNYVADKSKKTSAVESGCFRAEFSDGEDEVIAEAPLEEEQMLVTDASDCLLRSVNRPTNGKNKSVVGYHKIFNHLVCSATNTDTVHTALQALMSKKNYVRLNPVVPVVRIDDTNKEVLDDLKARTKTYMSGDLQQQALQRIKEAITHTHDWQRVAPEQHSTQTTQTE
ncbi:patatin-like phospholipase family protein, putative [Babesia bigemina]|uniref:Patatin-like phospholipase family protein, putative n=1 Tax=Babesia bigemina TaxID=5866 RepID=A0A061D6X7_BABBI|nr:patatin-like phospholipase family protein, putative [Babesia bigemina]CDR96283.1 patatin-like phospholipase family protein, putative [Babesia bigemina]|eukprot:XP_012768469.1 patatin-like phospholipase family protein, putative [Babesia bigemina]